MQLESSETMGTEAAKEIVISEKLIAVRSIKTPPRAKG